MRWIPLYLRYKFFFDDFVIVSTENSQGSEKSDSSKGRKRKNNSGAPAAKRVKDGKYKIKDVIDKEVSCYALGIYN